MHDITFEIKQLKELLVAKLNHSFIKDIIPKPLIDEDKLAIVYFLCSDNNQTKVDSNKKMISIMLMQIALDTHERIPNKNGLSLNLVEKQMTVLIGDYYSSLYYYLLAEINEIDLVQKIALSTKLINEHKVNLHHRKISSSDQLYASLETIESDLFTTFSIYLEKEYLVPIIKSLFLYNRLLHEKNLIMKDENLFLLDYFKKFMSFENKSSILKKLNEKMNECIYHIEHSLQVLPYEHQQLKRYINKRLELFDKSCIAEEG